MQCLLTLSCICKYENQVSTKVKYRTQYRKYLHIFFYSVDLRLLCQFYFFKEPT